MAGRPGRPRLARGPSRQKPRDTKFPGITCASQCQRPATQWKHLNYWCDQHAPVDRPSNCTHPHTMTMHGKTSCSWCCIDLEETE